MSLQTGSIRFGIAAQATAGTAATDPEFIFGVSDGNIPVEQQRETDELTGGYASAGGVYISQINTPFAFSTYAFPKMLGRILEAGLGAVSSVAKTHTAVHARPLPYLTVFKEHGAGGAIHSAAAGKIDTLRFEWEANGPLIVSVDGVAAAFGFPATMTPVTDETDAAYLRPVGGTFKLAVSGAVPALASVKGGFVEITNSAEAEHYSGTLTAGDVTEGWHEVTCGFTVVPDDLAWWRTLLTGSAAGTTMAAEPVYGSFEHVFKQGANELKLEAAKVNFAMEPPSAEAKGGKWETELAGICVRPSGWSGPLKATLKNDVTSYNGED